MKKRPSPPREPFSNTTSVKVSTLPEVWDSTLTETPLEPNPLLDLVKTGPWLDKQVFRPTEWVIPGLAPEGFGLLTGPPKIGKSWFALSVSLGSAAGGKVLGRIDVKARPVLYLALEDGDRRLQDR